MSTDIKGWVEIQINESWFGVIHINVLLERNYPIFDFLFGGRSSNYHDAIAGKRGIPDDSSIAVKADLGEGQGYEASWITLAEIKAIQWEHHQEKITPGWQRLFDMMTLLENDPRIKNIRLVVDFF